MNGYMNGAKTELPPKRISPASINRTTTRGISHHFFSCFKNDRNSLQSCHILSSRLPLDSANGKGKGGTLVCCNRIGFTIAARNFSRRRGESDEHIPQWICKERTTKSARKRTAALWVALKLACGFVARRLQTHWRGMRPPRASPQANLNATIVKRILLQHISLAACSNREPPFNSDPQPHWRT